MKKKLSIWWCDAAEGHFFFDGDSLITMLSDNDAAYREEYMDCLFNHFGIEVVQLKKLTAKQRAAAVREFPDYFEEES